MTRIQKRHLANLDASNDSIYRLVDNYIEKAVRYIKVKQFDAGFPEIFSPEHGGDIEVSIKQHHESEDLFQVSFRFLVLPSRSTLFCEQKIINYKELKRLALSYDKHKHQIDEELKKRDDILKINSQK